MSEALPIGVEKVEKDRVELTITVADEYVKQAETKPVLQEIITYAVNHGFTRFAGGTRGESEKGIKMFFFSIPEYFDKDDMLVSDAEIKRTVQWVMEEEFGL